MYRINYGNGQVSNNVRTLKEAEVLLLEAHKVDGYSFIQRYEGEGDWSNRTKSGAWKLSLY